MFLDKTNSYNNITFILHNLSYSNFVSIAKLNDITVLGNNKTNSHILTPNQLDLANTLNRLAKPFEINKMFYNIFNKDIHSQYKNFLLENPKNLIKLSNSYNDINILSKKIELL